MLQSRQCKKKNKKKSGLDLRCGRFLLWTYPERQQCLRSHPNLGVCFLYSRNSWICIEISVCCHCLRSHWGLILRTEFWVSCGIRSIVVNFVLTTICGIRHLWCYLFCLAGAKTNRFNICYLQLCYKAQLQESVGLSPTTQGGHFWLTEAH